MGPGGWLITTRVAGGASHDYFIIENKPNRPNRLEDNPSRPMSGILMNERAKRLETD